MAVNYFVVFEGKKPGIYSSWEEARKDENIQGQYFRTLTTFVEAFAVFSIYKEPTEVRLLRAALYGAPKRGNRTRQDGILTDHIEEDIEDAMLIGKWVAENPVAAEGDEEEFDKDINGATPSTSGESSNQHHARDLEEEQKK